jgi:hypothetical protein
VFDDLRKRPCLLDPARHDGFARNATNELLGLVDLDEPGSQDRGNAMGEFGGGIDAGLLEQIGALGADADQAMQVDGVDPLQDQANWSARSFSMAGD